MDIIFSPGLMKALQSQFQGWEQWRGYGFDHLVTMAALATEAAVAAAAAAAGRVPTRAASSQERVARSDDPLMAAFWRLRVPEETYGGWFSLMTEEDPAEELLVPWDPPRVMRAWWGDSRDLPYLRNYPACDRAWQSCPWRHWLTIYPLAMTT